AVEQGHPRPSSLRTLAGFSMGGYGAADIALHHPQVFGSVVCLEGYFHVDDPSHVLGRTTTALAAHTPTAELAALGNRPMFLADYANDTEPVVAGESQRMASLLAQRKAIYQLVTVPGAGHGLAPLPGLWPDIERYLARTAWRQ
ncbi:MAG TPA: alpha/beta hydrolase-fold protein, partial [Mycobacteriales bacterium]|nr:alpha/beta hydrolase-fold protein [Mycobacteriales bacterium]